MTLDKHEIDGLPGFTRRTMSATQFEALMDDAGYEIVGTAPGQLERVKIWWSHPTHRLVESIYSPDKTTVITAYHTGE
jgi:hypothetical protein